MRSVCNKSDCSVKSDGKLLIVLLWYWPSVVSVIVCWLEELGFNMKILNEHH